MVAVGSIVVVLAEVSVGVTASNIWKRSEKIVRLKVSVYYQIYGNIIRVLSNSNNLLSIS